jgi:D-3-phosphoglycerate dehydrogenase
MAKKFKTGIYSVVVTENEIESKILGDISDVCRYTSRKDFEDAFPELDGLIVDITPVTDDMMTKMKKLKIVVRHGMGADNIDIAAATKHHIIACNVPRFNLEEVSDYALAAALALGNHLPQYTWRVMQDKSWLLQDFEPKTEIQEMTLGILGLGQIGSLLAKKAKPLFKKIISYDPYMNMERAASLGVEVIKDIDDVFRQADIVSVHVPLSPETRNLVNAERLKLMKKTAYLINTSRGGLVDVDALQKALHSKQIAGAAIDVLDGEPTPDMNHPIFREPGIILTPHVAWYSEQSLHKLRVTAAEEIRDAYLGKRPVGQLNKF